MITGWEIYWITRLDALCVFFFLSGVTFIVCAPLVAIFLDDFFDAGRKKRAMGVAVSLVVGIAFLIVAVMTPTTNQAVAIYMIPKIVNNEQVQKLPDNAMKFLNGKFEEWINGMVEKKEKK